MTGRWLSILDPCITVLIGAACLYPAVKVLLEQTVIRLMQTGEQSPVSQKAATVFLFFVSMLLCCFGLAGFSYLFVDRLVRGQVFMDDLSGLNGLAFAWCMAAFLIRLLASDLDKRQLLLYMLLSAQSAAVLLLSVLAPGTDVPAWLGGVAAVLGIFLCHLAWARLSWEESLAGKKKPGETDDVRGRLAETARDTKGVSRMYYQALWYVKYGMSFADWICIFAYMSGLCFAVRQIRLF